MVSWCLRGEILLITLQNDEAMVPAMLIAVAGPYSAPTEEQRQRNLDEMNRVAAEVMRLGHIPIIGVNAALGVVEAAAPPDPYAVIMAISLAVVERCDAILVIGESAGVNAERELVASKGLPVYTSLSQIPLVD